VLISKPSGFYTETEGMGVYNSDHQLIGDIVEHQFDKITIVTFFLKNEDKKQELLDFIRIIIDDMKFTGFTVVETREFDGNSIDILTYNKPYLPKSQKALEKWKKAYQII